jgi:hypothetical protein
MRNGRWLVVSAFLALAAGAPALAQDADPPAEDSAPDSTPGGVDARELLGDRAEPPKMDDDGPTLQQGENAGRMIGTMATSDETRIETVTESRETSVRIGPDPNAPPPNVPPAAAPGWGGPGWGPPGGRPGGAESLAGEWTLLVDGGNSCRIELTDSRKFEGYAANTRGCEKDFFLVSRWAGGSGEIRFLDAFDKVAGQLRRTGPARFEGTRGSDGARIVLTR